MLNKSSSNKVLGNSVSNSVSNPASNVLLAWHFYKQEFGYSHQRLLRWVQAILMIFIVTLNLSSESIQQYLSQNLEGLLGADAVISQKQPLTPAQYENVRMLTQNMSTTQQIKTMLTHQGEWQQAQLKAVDEHYPLQGELLTSSSLEGEGEASIKGPEQGHIWLDARLIASLSIAVGEDLILAGKPFKVAKILQHEPDRLMEGHSVEMRAMINTLDMNDLNFSVDLIHFRYLLTANSDQTSQIIKWQKENLPAAEVLHKQGRHPLALFWQRTENFMGLASIILFFMAAIAIEQVAQVHKKKDQFFTAVCMSLGASKTTGIQVSIFKWAMSILIMLPLVLVLSLVFHYLIVEFLNDTFADLSWQLDLFSTLKPISAVILIFAIFHAPVWAALFNSTVAQQLIGRDKNVNLWASKVSSLMVLFIVAYSYSDNGLLTFMMLAAITITIVLMIVISWGSLSLGEKLTQKFSGLIPFTLFMMKQRLVSKSTQILGVGLCAFLLLFTLMLLKDIGATMSAYQRQHDGNVFISQATEAQMDYIQNWAMDKDVSIRQVKPYMHAKLIEINDQSLSEFSDKPSDSMATFSRSIRLHWSEQPPQNNRIVDGNWWQENTSDWQQVSIEQEVMTDLGLKLNDKLTFFINNQSYQFKITASHEFKAGSGSITFWVQMPPSALEHVQAAQYNMASIELAGDQWSMLAPLWQKFPTLRMVSLKEITQLFDKTLAMITKVISGFSLMIIMLSGVVILASINALESREKKKNSIVMSFGFSKNTCLKLNVIEWLVTASITAVGAIFGTYIAGLLIYQSQFSLTYQPSFTWLAMTLMIIVSVITSLGVYASRNNLRSSVRELLTST